MTPGCRNSRRSAHNPGSPNRQEPEGPAAKARTRYVFGHILVADETLGRYLVEGKSVRHINGVRDDNRPENLELWTKPQPSGVRVSDASATSTTFMWLTDHLQQGSRFRLSTLGGGGNRTSCGGNLFVAGHDGIGRSPRVITCRRVQILTDGGRNSASHPRRASFSRREFAVALTQRVVSIDVDATRRTMALGGGVKDGFRRADQVSMDHAE